MVPLGVQAEGRIPARPCPLCGGARVLDLHRQLLVVPQGHPLVDGYTLVSCDGCGLVYADTKMVQADYDRFYAEHSKYADERGYVPAAATSPTPTTIEAPPWDLARLRATAGVLAGACTDRTGPVIDLGCGAGWLLTFLAEEGFTQLTGLDPSPRAAAVVNARVGMSAIAGSLTDPPPELFGFAVATLAHVLEHLWDLDAAMSALAGLLAPGGLVYAEVPDASRYADYLVAPYHDINTEHINHFSPQLLRSLFESYGYTTELIEPIVVGCAPDLGYPAVRGLFRYPQSGLAARQPPDSDPNLRSSIQRFLDGSAQLLAGYDRELRTVLRGRAPVLWGAGELSHKLLTLPALVETGVLAIVDGSDTKQGSVLAGMAVLAPSELQVVGAPVVIGSVHHRASVLAAVRARCGDQAEVVMFEPVVSAWPEADPSLSRSS